MLTDFETLPSYYLSAFLKSFSPSSHSGTSTKLPQTLWSVWKHMKRLQSDAVTPRSGRSVTRTGSWDKAASPGRRAVRQFSYYRTTVAAPSRASILSRWQVAERCVATSRSPVNLSRSKVNRYKAEDRPEPGPWARRSVYRELRRRLQLRHSSPASDGY